MKFKVKSILLALLSLMLVSVCFATTMRTMEMKEIASTADEIIIGQCTEKVSKWVGGRIETTITFAVSESIKGVKKAGDVVEITQMGGEIEKYKIGQYVPGMPEFYKGEKSLLFLATTPPKVHPNLKVKQNPKSKLNSTPRVVGLFQGKFNIVQDEKTKKLYAIRYNLGNVNLIAEDDTYKKIDTAVAKQSEFLKQGELKAENIALTEQTAKNIKEKSAKPKQSLKKNAQGYDVVNTEDINQTKDSIKELDSFKNEIKNLIKK